MSYNPSHFSDASPFISIIVCCHNGAARLPDTLAHLARQDMPGNMAWEVIVVDNASTDGTAAIAAQAWQNQNAPAPFRILSHPVPGLSHARRAGVMASASELILFCDDDNWLAPDYAARAISIMQAAPEIGALGGRTEAAFEGERAPEWPMTLATNFAIGRQAERSGDVTEHCLLWGAGLVVRAAYLRRLYQSGMKPALMGRSGTALLSGDDSEICAWYRLGGYRLHYDETLSLRHFVPRARQTLPYAEGIVKANRRAARVLSGYRAHCERAPVWQAFMSGRRTAALNLIRNEARLLLRGRRVRAQVALIRRITGGTPPLYCTCHKYPVRVS